jgi:hypothetical protein
MQIYTPLPPIGEAPCNHVVYQGLVGNVSGKNQLHAHVNLGPLFYTIRRLREKCIRTSREEHALTFWTVLFV